MEEYEISINSPEIGAIIDRGLAIKAAVKENLKHCSVLHCQLHIDRNLISFKWEKVISDWHIANQALTHSEHTNAMDRIKKSNLQAFEYISNLDNSFLYLKKNKFYNMKTSNLIEQLNSEFLEERHASSIYQLIYSVITKSIAKQQSVISCFNII